MMESVIFEVVGDRRLGCASCEQRVERALKSMEGVRRVRAYAGEQRIEVLFDAAVQNVASIVERITKVGYETRGINQRGP